MKKRQRTSALATVALLALSLFASPVLAAEEAKAEAQAEAEAPATLTSMWLVTPQAGQEAAFETALKEFVAWRKANGDPFSWAVYVPTVGDNLNQYGIRSNPHFWKDEDTQRDWNQSSGANAEYAAKLAPLVADVRHYMDEFDLDLSRWNYEGTAPYVGVSTVQVIPGKWDDVKSALETFKQSADEQKWTESWAVMHGIGGRGGLMFAWPYDNYADMADPEMTGSAMLEKALGSKEKVTEVMQSYRRSIKSVDYTIWAHRPDLSTQNQP